MFDFLVSLLKRDKYSLIHAKTESFNQLIIGSRLHLEQWKLRRCALVFAA